MYPRSSTRRTVSRHSRDPAALAARVRSGTFGVNEGYVMDPAAPFVGVKNIGYGRELGTEGIDSYTVSQSISAATS